MAQTWLFSGKVVHYLIHVVGGAADCLHVLQCVLNCDHCMQNGATQKDHVMMKLTVIHCKVMERGVAHYRTVMQGTLHCKQLEGVADQH